MSYIGRGTEGQILTDNSNGILPNFQTSSSFIEINNQVFTTSDTYTPTTGMTYCFIQCLGGGAAGGGSGATTSGQHSIGTGGGGGEYAAGIFTAATIGASQTVTIGAGGTGVSASAGGNGGNTSLGSIISAYGGSGGTTVAPTGANTFQQGGAGGTGGSGGDYRTPGQNGSFGICGYTATINVNSPGGNSQIGAGGFGNNAANGGNAGGYGAGGGGTSNPQSASSALTGGNGTSGIIIVTEYIMV